MLNRPVAAFRALILAILAASLLSPQAQAAFPERPIKMVVGYAAGGPSDIIARLLAAKLSELLGQQVYVENRAGASGNIATEVVSRATPDGYTLLMATLPNAVNETLYPDFKYKFGKDIVAVAPVADTSLVAVVNPSLGVKSIAELIAYTKAHPGELYATAGRGTATHLAGELFSLATDAKLVPVHYKGGGETIKDLMSGQVKLMFSSIPPVLGLVRDKTLLGLATTGLKRDPTLPDLPTIEEAGLPSFNLSLWYGIAAPAGTPEEVIQRLDAATAEALKDPKLMGSLAQNGYHPMGGTRKDFTDFVQSEVQKWKKVVESSSTMRQ